MINDLKIGDYVRVTTQSLDDVEHAIIGKITSKDEKKIVVDNVHTFSLKGTSGTTSSTISNSTLDAKEDDVLGKQPFVKKRVELVNVGVPTIGHLNTLTRTIVMDPQDPMDFETNFLEECKLKWTNDEYIPYYVMTFDFNSKNIKRLDIMQYLIEELKSLAPYQYKDVIKDETSKMDYLIKKCRYMYWSRVQYEIMMNGVVSEDENAKKIDVYTQIINNIEVVYKIFESNLMVYERKQIKEYGSKKRSDN